MNLREMLEREVQLWQHLHNSALLQCFVLRNGVEFTGASDGGLPKGPIKECFGNAAKASVRYSLDYYEGYVLVPDLFPIQHAWCAKDDHVLELTLNDPTSEHTYLGVFFPHDVLCRTLVKQKYYGLLSDGIRFNLELINQLDPELMKEMTP